MTQLVGSRAVVRMPWIAALSAISSCEQASGSKSALIRRNASSAPACRNWSASVMPIAMR